MFNKSLATDFKNLSVTSGFDERQFIVPGEKKNWREARENCQNYRGDLISIRSRSENSRIKDVINLITSSHDFWIGLARLEVINQGQSNSTQHHTSLQNRPYSNWNCKKSGEDCVTISTAMDGKWNSNDCKDNFHFICNIRNSELWLHKIAFKVVVAMCMLKHLMLRKQDIMAFVSDFKFNIDEKFC